MYEHITTITQSDLQAAPATESNEAWSADLIAGASLGAGTLLLPFLVLGITFAFTRDMQIAAALCFFTYAQLAHVAAKRRSLKRKSLMVELFRLDQKRASPKVLPAGLDATLATFTSVHRRAALAEILGVPLGALALVAFELGKLGGLVPNALQDLVVIAATIPLVAAIGVVFLSHRELVRMQYDLFDDSSLDKT